MDAKTLRMLATMVLLASSAFTMLAEAKPHCNGRKFKDNTLLSDRIRSVLEIMQFHAKLNVGETVTKMLEDVNVSGKARCSGKLSEQKCKLCLNAAIKDIKRACRDNLGASVSGSQCSINYTVKK